jgi:hypothetical protein
MDSDRAIALIEQRRDAWLHEDVDAYLRLFADEFAFFVNGVDLTRGLPALANAVRRSYLRFRPGVWEFHHIAVDRSCVLTEWTATMQERTSGETRMIRAMSSCELRDDLAIWQREYRSPPVG